MADVDLYDSSGRKRDDKKMADVDLYDSSWNIRNSSMNVLSIIADSQNAPNIQIYLKARGFGIDEEETNKALETLQSRNLVGKTGNIYYATSKGIRLANKSSVF